MVDHPPPSRPTRLAEDTGLLSPVRAGTPIEATLDDRAWLQGMLDAEAALARAQARLGHIPEYAATVIMQVADADLFDVTDLARRSRGAANPVVTLVSLLAGLAAAKDPRAAEFVHRGSTSQDILDTGVMLVAARSLAVIDSDLRLMAATLAALAGTYRDTPMAGRTLTQHAVPITFGLKVAGWLQLVLDARARIDRLHRCGLPVQLGGAAGSLAGYLEVAAQSGLSGTPAEAVVSALFTAFAEETGLCEPALPWHTQRTPIADLAAVLTYVAGALGKIALDVQSMARTETAEVSEPAADGRGASSAMPHKRNPVLATMIRSAAMQVPMYAAVLSQCLLAEDERPGGPWQAEWLPLRECLRLVGGASATASELLSGLVVAPDRMRANLTITGGQIVSERVAVVLAPALGRSRSKALLTEVSNRAARGECSLRRALAEAPEIAGRWSDATLDDLLDPTAYLGASAALVERVLERYRTAEPPV